MFFIFKNIGNLKEIYEKIVYSWIFTSFPQDSRMFQRLKKMKSWNLIKSTLNLNQIKTVNLDKKEKRKIERERYYSLFCWWEHYNKSHLHKFTRYDSPKDRSSKWFFSDSFDEASCWEGLDSKYVWELWDFPLWGDGSAHRNQRACRRMLAPSLAITSLASSLSRTQKMKEGEGGQNR